MDNSKIHILIVDDDDKIRDLLKQYLKNNNFFVSTAINASDAEEKLKIVKFDLAIIDIMMPGKDGLQLTKEIREKIDLPIILLTAKGEADDRVRGLELGAEDYLPKPFEPKELLLRIKNVIKRIKKNKHIITSIKIGKAFPILIEVIICLFFLILLITFLILNKSSFGSKGFGK